MLLIIVILNRMPTLLWVVWVENLDYLILSALKNLWSQILYTIWRSHYQLSQLYTLGLNRWDGNKFAFGRPSINRNNSRAAQFCHTMHIKLDSMNPINFCITEFAPLFALCENASSICWRTIVRDFKCANWIWRVLIEYAQHHHHHLWTCASLVWWCN